MKWWNKIMAGCVVFIGLSFFIVFAQAYPPGEISSHNERFNGDMLGWLCALTITFGIFIIGLYWMYWNGKTSQSAAVEKLKTRIADLETLCRFDDIPELLIENPTLCIGQKPTEKDIEWAKKAIEKYENSKPEHLNTKS